MLSCFVLFHPIKKSSFNLLCVLDLSLFFFLFFRTLAVNSAYFSYLSFFRFFFFLDGKGFLDHWRGKVAHNHFSSLSHRGLAPGLSVELVPATRLIATSKQTTTTKSASVELYPEFLACGRTRQIYIKKKKKRPKKQFFLAFMYQSFFLGSLSLDCWYFLAPNGRRLCTSPHCLESQDCYLCPLFYLLACFSA